MEGEFKRVAEDDHDALERMGLLDRSLSPTKREEKSPTKAGAKAALLDGKRGEVEDHTFDESESDSSRSGDEQPSNFVERMEVSTRSWLVHVLDHTQARAAHADGHTSKAPPVDDR